MQNELSTELMNNDLNVRKTKRVIQLIKEKEITPKEAIIEHIANLPTDTNLLFPNKNNNYYNANNIRNRVWKPLLEKSGITKRVRLHDLRGCYTDYCVALNLPIKFIQQQLGHAKADMTLNCYAQNNSDMIAIAKSTMNKHFKSFNNVVSICDKRNNNTLLRCM